MEMVEKDANWLGEDGSWMEETCSPSEKLVDENGEIGNKLRHGDGGKEGNWLGRDLFPKWRI